MRNINKILGVILTLALLAGSLAMAIPVAAADEFAAAATDTWLDDNNTPTLVMGTDANVYDIAADGTTMFMWTNTTTALSQAVAFGATTVNVQSTDGFPSSGSARIAALIPFTYTGKTPTSFTGCTNVPVAAATDTVAPYIGAGLPAATITAGAANNIGATTLTVASTAGYPTSGRLTINVGALAETVNYSAVPTGATFTVSALTKNHAAGVAVVLASGAPANASAVYKSIDAGLTWLATNLTAPATAVGVPITMLKVNPVDTQQLVACDGTNLYRSVNGGKNWSAAIPLATFGAATVIRSIDVAEGTDGTTILVGTDAGVWQSDPALGAWNALAGPVGVYAVAFSPDYINDEQVLAVECTGATTQLRTKLGTGAWDADVAVGTLKEDNTTLITAIASACLAFPSDYYWGGTNQVFVGLDATTPATAGDVYRVNGALVGSTTSVKDTGVDADVFSVAVAGTKSDSTVIASKVGSGITRSTDADTASAPDWSSGGIKSTFNNQPALMLASTGILYAGDAGAHSGFYQASPDFKSYNGISRMEVNNIYKYTFSRGVVAERPFAAYFYTTPEGNYEMRLATATGFAENPGGVRGSAIMYAVDNARTKQIQKSIDAGLTWNVISSPGNKDITTLAVVNDDLYYIGYTGYIRSNTGPALALSTVNADPSTITIIGSKIIVGTGSNAGRNPTTWLYSVDSGATFEVLGAQDKWATCLANKYVASQNTIYVVDATNVVWTWELGTDTEWQQAKALGITLGANDISKILVVSDVMFIAVKDTAGTGFAQIYRSIQTKSGTFDFRAIPDTTVAAIGGQVDGISVYDNEDGSFNIKPTLKPINTPYPVNIGTSIGKLYADTTIGQLALNSPVNGAELNNPVDLGWTKAKKSRVTYEWEIARDEGFDFVVATGAPTVPNVFGAGGALTTGLTYYWRVRINIVGGLNGLWSDTRSFIVKTIGSTTNSIDTPTSVYPPQGEVNISTTPVLTWGLIPGATYNVKIATDSAFTSVIDQKDGLTKALYTPAKALEPNKTYFWEVQAVSGGIASDWVAFAFTTAAPVVPAGEVPPAVQPTYTFNVPTQAAPAITVTQVPDTTPPPTPGYIWFIIVIGAVLVIAVIVLIVRTRRV